jgi:hypothetical protein
MARGLDKKVLLFADEHGTPGDASFGFGFVGVRDRDVQKVSAAFERYLTEQANSEFRSANLPPHRRVEIVRAVQARLAGSVAVSFSIAKSLSGRTPPDTRRPAPKDLYVDSLTHACRRLLAAVQRERRFGRMDNVELIVDRNSLNETADFQRRFLEEGGRLRAVRHVAVVDSAASRLLQLSDAVASMLNPAVPGSESADVLENRTGVKTY